MHKQFTATAIILLLLSTNSALAISDQVRSMCREAEQMINSRRFKPAIKLLRQAEKIEPNAAEVHGYLGMAYQNSLNTQQAVVEYEKALQLNPGMSFININLGTCYMNLRQPQKAVPFFQAYLRENPNAPNRAQVEAYIKQSGVRQGRNNLRTNFERGQALLNRGQAREAASIFQNIVSQNPGFAPGHFFLAYALAKMGNHQGAIREFQQALKIDPNQREAVINIGSNYQSLGDINNAIMWYQRYLSMNPPAGKARDVQNRINGLKKQARENQKKMARQPQYNQPPRPQYNQAPQQAFNQPNPNFAPNQQFQGQPNNIQPAPYTAPQNDYINQAASGGRLFRWPAQAMPVAVFIANGKGLNGYRENFPNILSRAFMQWSNASGNRLTFRMVNNSGQANIICQWTDNPDKIVQRGQLVEGGLTKLSGQPVPGSNSVNITKAKMVILTRPREGDNPSMNDDDMMKVCLHEVGHASGINGHSNNNQDVMFFSESPSIWPSLTKRDKNTIFRLYSN